MQLATINPALTPASRTVSDCFEADDEESYDLSPSEHTAHMIVALPRHDSLVPADPLDWAGRKYELKQSGRKITVPWRYVALPCGCRRSAEDRFHPDGKRNVWHLRREQVCGLAGIVHMECDKIILVL